MKKGWRFLAIGVALLTAPFLLDRFTFDQQAALLDFEAVKDALAQHYANLDWMRDHREMDLQALAAETQARLTQSRSRLSTYRAMKAFIEGFEDPHLFMDWGDAPDYAADGRVSSTDPDVMKARCDAAGYDREDLSTDLSYADLSEWVPVESPFFPGGLLGDVGILRIAEFGEGRYRDACRLADADTDDQRALQLATRQVLQAELTAMIGRLDAAGATHLVVDLTGNGGGSEWSVLAASLFADGPLRRYRPSLPAPDCDRSPIWSNQPVCPVYDPPEVMIEIEGQSVWTGPLVLLLDRNSASATESFAAWLMDNDRAQLVGERTLGAGCGFISGGVAISLSSLPTHIMMPNCSRYTLDGVNEIEGLAPDRAVNWDDTTDYNAEDWADILIARPG